MTNQNTSSLVGASSEIKNERENFRNLFKQTPEMVCILMGPEHVFEFVNDAHIRALGFDATGKTVREAQPESVEVYGILDEVYKTGKTAELKEIPVTLTDRRRFFNLTFSAHRDTRGKINGVMVLGAEITEQFLTREMLKNQNTALKMAMDGTALAKILEVLAQGIESHLARGVQSSILLLDQEGVHLRHGAAPSLPEEYNQAIDGLKIGPEVGSCGTAAFHGKEVNVKDISSSPLWKNFRDLAAKCNLRSCWSTPLFSSKGDSIGTFALYNRPPIDPSSQEQQVLNLITQTVSLVIERERNIQNKINTEQELVESKRRYLDSEEQLGMAVDVAKVGFYNWDIPSDKVTFSEQMYKDWGITEGVTTLSETFSYIHEDDRDQVENLIKKSLETKVAFHYTCRVVKDEDNWDWVEIRGRVQTNIVGEPVRIFGTSIKVTEQKEREEKLQQAQITADKANFAKGAFLANMSHEIRTPLGAITGFLKLLKDPNISRENLDDYIGVIEGNSKQLLRIVNDVLDLSKIESGKFQLEAITFSLVELFKDFNSLMAFKAREKGLTYEMKLDSSIPSTIVNDPTRLRQILSNIVGNAVKFTTKGYVQIKVTFGNDKLNIEVKDSGSGISDKAKERLFIPFSQGDNSTTRLYGGTGLGLHLTKRLSEAMNGKFYLKKSIVGQGSTFAVSLPIVLAANTELVDSLELFSEKTSIKKLARQLPPMHVLVVEDAIENQRLIKIILESWGATLKLASNGKEGYKTALSEKFDLILMDVQMPVMDGHESTSLLRSEGYKNPIIALTAHAMEEERNRCLASGFTSFLTKPIDNDQLFRTLLEFAPEQV